MRYEFTVTTRSKAEESGNWYEDTIVFYAPSLRLAKLALKERMEDRNLMFSVSRTSRMKVER